jgi:predicted phage tail protein
MAATGKKSRHTFCDTNQKMVTVILLGELGRRFGRRHQLAISSAAEAIRALAANFPAFERELVASGERGVGYRVLAGRDPLTLERLHEPTGSLRITLAPVVSGAGGNGLGQILLGAALIAVAWWNPMGWAASGAFLSQATLYSVGTSMILGGVAQMIAPTPKASEPSERAENKPSYSFNGAVNTTAQGHPVPVGYGRLIVGSAVISAGIDVSEIPV